MNQIARDKFRLGVRSILAGLFGVLLSVGAEAQAGGTVTGKITLAGRAAGIPPTNVIVSIEGLRSTPPASTSYVLDQKNITFLPHVLPVLAGSQVQIRNSDAILHTVHTTSKLNPGINRASLANGTDVVTFQKPEEIVVGCDVHSEMHAYILVKENPFFTRLDRQGRFTLAGVPEGKYTLRIWTERTGNTDQSITAPGKDVVVANITVR